MWIAILIALIAAAFALVIAPRVLENLRSPVTAADRQGADGEFANLSQGVTHYRWIGPVRGPVAVVIHGLTTPSIGMQAVAEGLANLGYRVLAYDLYGRGLSDAPAGLQDRRFFLRQLNDLLADQALDADLTLVGYSMGGAIATAFAAENPHFVKRVILLAPACIEMSESDFSRFCRETRGVGDWVHGLIGARRMRRAIPQDARRPEIGRVLLAQRQALKRRGYLPALLSSRRGMLMENQQADHDYLRKADVPVVAVWAAADEAIPVSASTQLARWNHTVRQEIVPDARHALPYTHADEVIAAIRTLLRD